MYGVMFLVMTVFIGWWLGPVWALVYVAYRIFCSLSPEIREEEKKYKRGVYERQK